MLHNPIFKLVAIATLLFALNDSCSAQYRAESSQQQPAQTGRLDNLAIQDSIAGYLNAINDRDAQRAATFWSTSGEWINEDGSRVRGQNNIAAALAKTFEQDPSGMQVTLRDLTIRIVTANVAVEDGVAVVSIPGEQDSESHYSVVHVKQNGSWKIDSVRETLTPTAPQRRSQLEKLSWLVGDWVDQLDGETEVRTSCAWTEGNKALRRSFQVESNDGVILSGTQVIVWDARLGKIRSWVFDSDGGFGNGVWEQQDSGIWTVDSEYQLGDGGVAASTNVYSKISDSGHEFYSVDRTVDGAAVPDTNPVRVSKRN